MKKICLLLLLLPITLFAQIVNNRYKFSLIPGNLRMELTSGNFIRVAEDCRDRTPNCGSQVWFVAGVRGKPNVYQITLITSRSDKYLTWEEATPDATTLNVKLEPRYPTAKQKFQQFIFTLNDKGSYQIQPALEEATTNDFYLGANLATGTHNGVRLFKKGLSQFREVRDAWVLAPPITPLPEQRSEPVIVSAPSDNKLDIDIKTGADNLEPKSTQHHPEIRIILKDRPDVIKQNINDGREWPNNSIKRISIPLPADITINDIKELHLYRKRDGLQYVWQLGEKDNWNVDKISATAKLKLDGVMKSFKFPDFISPLGSSQPLFRFVYEGGNGRNEGQFFKGILGYTDPSNYSRTPSNTSAKPILKIETLTGGDDLRGGNDNLNLLIRLKIRPVRNIALNNINNRENWGNFTEKTVTKTITTAPFTFDDIEDIVLRHTGGGGIGADNWYLDKLKIKLTINGETRVLVDQVAAPIHYFTGDSRSKTFQILR